MNKNHQNNTLKIKKVIQQDKNLLIDKNEYNQKNCFLLNINNN